MRGQNNVAKQPLVRADGVVSSAQVYRPENFAGLTSVMLRAIALALRARLRLFGGFASSY